MNSISIRNNSENSETWLDGYAAVFNQRSKRIFENGKQFFEIIKEGAFDEVLRSESLNVKAVVEHDPNKLLGRSKSGTLKLETNEKGLRYSVRMGNTQLHRDTLEMIERGDLYESSFKFSVGKGDSQFTRDENGDLLHIVTKIRGLYDVSIVGDGAYNNTDIAIRSALDEFELAEKQERLRQLKEENQSKRDYLTTLKNSL